MIILGTFDVGFTLHELAHFPPGNGQGKLERFGCSVLYPDAGPFYRRYRTLSMRSEGQGRQFQGRELKQGRARMSVDCTLRLLAKRRRT